MDCCSFFVEYFSISINLYLSELSDTICVWVYDIRLPSTPGQTLHSPFLLDEHGHSASQGLGHTKENAVHLGMLLLS